MAERAQVTSVEALEAFRASLIVFLSKARPTLEEISDDIRRTRDWLQSDRRSHWENEMRRRTRTLEQAEQALFSSKLSTFQSPTTSQQWEVHRAQRALREAEEKLRLVRKWCREFENLTDPLNKQLDQVHTLLTTDMRRAVAYLAEVVATLEAYADIAVPDASASPVLAINPGQSHDKGGEAPNTSLPSDADTEKPLEDKSL